MMFVVVKVYSVKFPPCYRMQTQFLLTSATAEHTFSALWRVKSFLRSTISQEYCMTLHIYKEKTYEIDLMKIIELQAHQLIIIFYSKTSTGLVHGVSSP